jgi:hypothetical protein
MAVPDSGPQRVPVSGETIRLMPAVNKAILKWPTE